jgi:multiple sugar transport system permease protein
MALGNYKFGRGAARAVVVVVLLTLFAIFYLSLLSQINRKVADE